MANPNAFFGAIAEISRDDRGLAITLGDGRTARIATDEKRAAALAAVLEDLRRRKMPVYLDADASGTATGVLLPKLVKVENIVERHGTEISVTFEQSHARHTVARDSPELRALREAGTARWLAVTVNDRFEIIDVRPYQPPFELPRFEPPPRLRWWHWCWWPWRWFFCWFRCMSMRHAQELFDLCAATTCDPLTVPAPCIPFKYPDDGCWGRAHEMCRLMIAAGASPRKVWIDGWLHTPTKNHPNCFVNWGWHVAPTLCVRRWRWWWWFGSEEMVIDPSLFTTPVTKATWKNIQGDPAAVLTDSSAELFARWGGGITDPTYVQTNQVLANYRTQLQLRSLGPAGPPPYANCP